MNGNVLIGYLAINVKLTCMHVLGDVVAIHGRVDDGSYMA